MRRQTNVKYEICTILRRNILDLLCVFLSVQQSYKALSLLVHPDRTGGGSEATEKFQVLGQVYDVLMNSPKRMTYDDEKFVVIVSEEKYTEAKTLYTGN